MLNEDQLADRLRTRLRGELSGVSPRPDLAEHIRRTMTRRARARWASLGAVPVAAVAVAIAATVQGGPVGPVRHPSAAPAPSARVILLTAARSAEKAPDSGKYWVIGEQDMDLVQAGTRTHPYSIADRTDVQSWVPRASRPKFLRISQDIGTRPATAADEAAWRASGSPAVWRFGGGKYGNTEQSYQTAASPVESSWEPLSYVRPNLGPRPVTFAMLQSLPASLVRLTAVLRQDAAHTPGVPRSLITARMFYEGGYLLTQPVTSQVRASLYRMLADLPGVRTMGVMTDSLGRRGYGIAMFAGAGEDNVLVVRPAAPNPLLAYENVVSAPGRVRVWADSTECHLQRTAALRRLIPPRAVCARLARDGARYVQYGMRYPGQVTRSYAYTRLGWSKSLPSAARPGAARG